VQVDASISVEIAATLDAWVAHRQSVIARTDWPAEVRSTDAAVRMLEPRIAAAVTAHYLNDPPRGSFDKGHPIEVESNEMGIPICTDLLRDQSS
jgi:hypothetical protein